MTINHKLLKNLFFFCHYFFRYFNIITDKDKYSIYTVYLSIIILIIFSLIKFIYIKISWARCERARKNLGGKAAPLPHNSYGPASIGASRPPYRPETTPVSWKLTHAPFFTPFASRSNWLMYFPFWLKI